MTTMKMLRDADARLGKLEAMARERGCELHEGPLDDEDHEGDVYLLFVLDYVEPVEFDDLDEVEFDILSRPVVTRKVRRA